MMTEPPNLYSECSSSAEYMQTAQPCPKFPLDPTKFLDGNAEFVDGGGGGTIEGTINVIQKGDGSGNAIDSSLQDIPDDGIHFVLGNLGNGPLDILSIKKLNFADVVISGENGADILMQSGSGGSFTIETDGAIGDDVILRCGSGGSPAVKIKSDRISFQAAIWETTTKDIAGRLTLVAGNARYDFVHPIGSGNQAIVVISPTTAPVGILSVLPDATGFDINSSSALDVVEVDYIAIMAPLPA